jgi:tetratricopeptide (TPR) repeat protein
LRLAVTQPSFKERLAEAKDLFYRAVEGDRPALDESRRILGDLGAGESPDAEVIAYCGAADLLAADHAFFFWDKASLGREGLALEDKAVAQAPEDLEVRFLRGVTNYQLPMFLGRHDLAVSDLAAVAKVAEAAAQAHRLDVRAAAADLDYYGRALEQKFKVSEAIAAWQAAVRISPNSPSGIDARKHLADHGIANSATQPTSAPVNDLP